MPDQPDASPLGELLEEEGVEASADPGEAPDATELDDDPQDAGREEPEGS